jgi:hypothetical protein
MFLRSLCVLMTWLMLFGYSAERQAGPASRGEAPIIWTGNQLDVLCRGYKLNKEDIWGTGCSAYILGVSHTLQFNPNDAILPGSCMGKSVTNQQSIDVVVKWLGDHPDKRDKPAPFLVASALNEGFACN